MRRPRTVPERGAAQPDAARCHRRGGCIPSPSSPRAAGRGRQRGHASCRTRTPRRGRGCARLEVEVDALHDRLRARRARSMRRSRIERAVTGSPRADRSGRRRDGGRRLASRSARRRRVEGVAQRVADEVERHHDGEDGETREDPEPPRVEVLDRSRRPSMPHSGVGGLAPSPRNDRPESSRIAVPMSRLASTSTGPTMFGGDVAHERAQRREAEQLPRRRRSSRCAARAREPRVRRAYGGHDTISAASTAFRSDAPSAAAMTIARMTVGNAITRSVTRMTTSSTRRRRIRRRAEDRADQTPTARPAAAPAG